MVDYCINHHFLGFFVPVYTSCSLCLKRIVGPVVFWVTAFQLFPHLEVGIVPETPKVLCQLHGFEAGRQ